MPHFRFLHGLAALLLFFLTLTAQGVELTGTCVSVTDGDTLVINTGKE